MAAFCHLLIMSMPCSSRTLSPSTLSFSLVNHPFAVLITEVELTMWPRVMILQKGMHESESRLEIHKLET